MRGWWIICFAAGCATTKTELATPAGPLTLVDFEPSERVVLEETIAALGALAGPPIDEATWLKRTAFERVYGFSFSGPAILAWWRARIDRLDRGDPWTVAVHDGQHGITLRADFFGLPLVDRLSVLIHEARHADAGGFMHDECPEGSGLGDAPACDALPLGAYTFQAAFLYELEARGLLDPARAGRGYKEARSRILSAYPAEVP
jgi:hypothetical protein